MGWKRGRERGRVEGRGRKASGWGTQSVRSLETRPAATWGVLKPSVQGKKSGVSGAGPRPERTLPRMAKGTLVWDGLGKGICQSKEGVAGRRRCAESVESKGTEAEVQVAPVSCSILIPTAYTPSQRTQVISPLLKGCSHAMGHVQSKCHTRDPSTLYS